MKKNIITIVLTFSMTLSMIGCGNSSESTEPQTTNIVTDDSGKSDTDADPAFSAYAETITIRTVTSESENLPYTEEGDDITDNIWIRAYKERFNINVVTDWVSNEYDTKLNLEIGSGDIPDVFYVTATQLHQLIEADMLADLSTVFDEYASDRVKAYMDEADDILETGKVDGKLFGIPQLYYGLIDQPKYIWIRNDWKDELNLPDPETIEDVKNISLAFMEAYDVYGIGIDQNLDYLNVLAPAWHAYPEIWITGTDGSIVYGSIQPEMKTALGELAAWYEEGIISPDFATTDYNAVVEANVSGKVGIQPFPQWWGWGPGSDVIGNLGKEAIFYPYSIPSSDEEAVLAPVSFPNNYYTVVSKSCENPEAALKLINFYTYMLSDDAIDAEEKDVISDFGKLENATGAFRVNNPNSDYEQFVQVSAALESGDTTGLTTSNQQTKYEDSVEFIENGTPSAVGSYLQQGADKSAYRIGKEILDDELYIKSELWGRTPEELLNYGSTLDDILTEGFTKIILGVESIDYFDTLVENWKTAGGDAVTQAMNREYNGN